MLEHQETCLCKKRTLDFTSDFDSDVVTKVFCPECAAQAPEDAIVFELCEPGEFNGTWAVKYNKGELKRLDPAFRDDDDYYLSLLIAGTVGPKIARNYRMGGLCRIFGFKGEGPDRESEERMLDDSGHGKAHD